MNRVVSYSVGLLLAMILTMTAFSLVLTHAIASPVMLIAVVLALAMVQLTVQLVFFLHLGQGRDNQWNALQFGFTFGAILVVILASVWIMAHLNYNMTPSQINQYLNDQSTF